MLARTLVLAALVSGIAAMRPNYDFEDPSEDALNVARIESLSQKLEARGITSRSTREDVHRVIKRLYTATRDITEKAELGAFVMMGDLKSGQPVDCTDARTNVIYDMLRAIGDDPDIASVPLYEYISAAHDVILYCLEDLSLNNWSVFEKKMESPATDTVIKMLGDTFNEPPKIKADDFWTKFQARERQVTKEIGRSAFDDFESAANRARVMIKNSGFPAPYRFMSKKAKALFTAAAIIDKYYIETAKINALDADHPDVFDKIANLGVTSNVSAAISIAAQKSGQPVDQVKNELVESCRSLGLELSSLSLAKTTYANDAVEPEMATVASRCYDILKL